MKLLDLTNQKFGKLVAKERIVGRWLCRCDCGKFRYQTANALRSGHAKSCGCGIPRTIHGESIAGKRSPEWVAYASAKQRCNGTNKQDQNYALYAGRGIQFKFSSYAQFLAEVGRKPSSQHSLDRKNTNGHYEPGNVRWATKLEQRINTRIKLRWSDLENNQELTVKQLMLKLQNVSKERVTINATI